MLVFRLQNDKEIEMTKLLAIAVLVMLSVIVCDQITIYRYKKTCKDYEQVIKIYQVAISNHISTIDFVLGKLEELK